MHRLGLLIRYGYIDQEIFVSEPVWHKIAPAKHIVQRLTSNHTVNYNNVAGVREPVAHESPAEVNPTSTVMGENRKF